MASALLFHMVPSGAHCSDTEKSRYKICTRPDVDPTGRNRAVASSWWWALLLKTQNKQEMTLSAYGKGVTGKWPFEFANFFMGK